MNFHQTTISAAAMERVMAVLRSGWVNEGPVVREFEQRLTDVLAFVNPVAVNSGTSALHLALLLAGVGPGDEVILPAQTFVATGLAVLMQRATPVFADIDANTGNIDPASIRERITLRTKAIIMVHWGGCPCDIDEINQIGRERGLAVIEDAAHAMGAQYRGRAVGAISRFTTFSFQATKHLTTGDGGALCCLDPSEAGAARARRWFGIDRSHTRASAIGARETDIAEPGFKYHMNDIAAAIGLGNLEEFPARLARRRAIAARYREELRGLPGLTLLSAMPDRESACWLFTLLLERRDDFVAKLRDKGVPASVVDLGIDRNSVFGGPRKDLRQQRYFDEHQAAIPVHDGLRDGDVDRVIRAVRSGW